ncbi:MAG: alpha/beta hydrolase [Pseudomonadota bacterium]
MSITGHLTLGSSNKVSFIETGNPDGFPILFLHGNSFSKEVFSGQLSSEHLSERRLLALDMPGHGHSSRAIEPKTTYTYAGFAAEVLNFLELKEIKRCVVAGWSLGGQVALELINRSPRVAGVFAFGAPPAPNGPIGLIRSMRFCRMLLLAGKPQFSKEDAIYFEKAAFGSHANGEFIDTLLNTDPEMRPTLSRSLLMPKGMSQRERFEYSSIPVCLLHGRDDILVRTPYMETLRAPMMAGGEVLMLDRVGHAPFLESKDTFDQLLDHFCDSVEKGVTVKTPAEFLGVQKAA